MKQAHCLIVLLGAFTLSACGGGGGGGGSGGTGPTTMTYTIGGTAQGVATYSSSGLVLQNNGGNDLTVPSDGSFTFASSVNSGAAYAVTVGTQPAGETCTVTNGSGTANANVTNIAVSCVSALANGSNVAKVSVGTFPSDVTAQVFNVPIVTVTVCDATTKCAPFQVMVDTGSSGLRLMSSAVTQAGLTITPETSGSNQIFECAYYADGYAWGGVYTASQVKIASETGSNVPIQVIATGTPTVPSSCVSQSPGGGNALNSPDAFSADGVLGIGVAAQDCGSACTSTALFYYACPLSGCTTGTAASTVTTAEQVTNPVTFFGTDDNGVILQLPAVGTNGAVSVGTTDSGSLPTGYLAFGVGTETDNAVGSAKIFPVVATQSGSQPLYINTNYKGQSEDGIIDSGSNALFFADSTLQSQTCPTSGSSFYCPGSAQTLSATNSSGGNNSTVTFQIDNLDSLHAANPSFYVFNDVGGPFPAVNNTSYFDWGLPFFYGRSVYTIIEGATVGGQTYTNGAFAY